MKRLSALVVLALCGCPDWEHERQLRCVALGSTDGVCAGAVGMGGGAPMGGGSATGGGTAGGGSGEDAGAGDGGDASDGGSAVDAGSTSDGGSGLDGGGALGFVFVPGGTPLLTAGSSTVARSPVFLWEEPFMHRAVAIEQVDAGQTSVWREADFSALGALPYRWCASATNAASSLLGSSVTNDSLVSSINVDDFAMNAIVNLDLQPTPCADALAQYVRPSGGGSVFMGMRADPNGLVHFEQRWRCATGMGTCSRDVLASFTSASIDEAVVDDLQQTWVSGFFSGQYGVVQVPPDLMTQTGLSSVVAASPAPTAGAELAVSGAAVTLGWVTSGSLYFQRLDVPGSNPTHFPLGQPAALVDLVSGPNGSVAVLTFSNDRNVLALFDGASVAFFELALNFKFRPTVAHLGTKLRIAGLCVDPVAALCPSNSSPPNNPIFEFPTKPDGGAW